MSEIYKALIVLALVVLSVCMFLRDWESYCAKAVARKQEAMECTHGKR